MFKWLIKRPKDQPPSGPIQPAVKPIRPSWAGIGTCLRITYMRVNPTMTAVYNIRIVEVKHKDNLFLLVSTCLDTGMRLNLLVPRIEKAIDLETGEIVVG